MNKRGFTLIELLVVVAIVGVLASMVMSSLNDARDRARLARVQADIYEIQKLITLAQIETDDFLTNITGSNCSFCHCRPDISDTACAERWELTIGNIVAAAGADPSVATALYRDPWGNPYLIDENQGEYGCLDTRPDFMGSSRGVTDMPGGFQSSFYAEILDTLVLNCTS